MKAGRIPEPGEVYSFYVKELGKYGAVQILTVEPKSVCYVTLDYLEDEPPAEQQIAGLKPFYWEHHRWHHHMAMCQISNRRVPGHYLRVGSCPPVTDKPCKAFSSEWDGGMDYVYQARWDAIDPQWRAEYKRAIHSGEQVRVGGNRYKKNLGGMRDALLHDLGEGDTLQRFPCITVAVVEGYSTKLTGLIRSSPVLRTLRLRRPGAETVDLRDTGLEQLELDTAGIRTLFLPEGLRDLELYGGLRQDFEIQCAPNVPESLKLSLKQLNLRDFGLRHVKQLRLYDVAELDLEDVARYYPEIELLFLQGQPGTVLHPQALGDLRQLEWIIWNDMFGYSAEDLAVLETLPRLRKLSFFSLPKQAGGLLKKRWKNKLDLLEVQRLREDTWLRENLDNPFRHWDGSEFVPEAAYQSVRRLWQKTGKQMKAADSRQAILDAVRQYTLQCSKLNRRYEEFIETEEREDIFAAMEKLYQTYAQEKGLISLQEVFDAMEEVRDGW